MNIIKEYTLEIRITAKDSKIGCDITNNDGELLYGVVPEYIHENDAVYAALHGLAVQNNFSGCLKVAEVKGMT